MVAAAAVSAGLFRPRVIAKPHSQVSQRDILMLFQQLATLFRSGTPIYQALSIAAQQNLSIKLRRVVEDVAARIASGATLSSALEHHRHHFKLQWVQIIRSGEDSGQLAEVLDRLNGQLEAGAKLRSKIISAMIYPAIVLVVAIAAVIVMLVFVVPTFAGMFESMGKDLPAITQNVLAVSDFVRHNGLVMFGGIAVAGFLFRQFIRTKEGRRSWHYFLISTPIIGNIMVNFCMQRFSNNAALLLRSGLPLLRTIESLQRIFENNAVYQDALKQAGAHVEHGGTLTEGLEKTQVFTSFLVSMARTGEESGNLAEVLDEVDCFYQERVQASVSRLTSILDGVIIIGMGCCVTAVLCAIYLPMFSMASGVS